MYLSASAGSRVAIAAVDKSLHILGGNNLITPKTVRKAVFVCFFFLNWSVQNCRPITKKSDEITICSFSLCFRPPIPSLHSNCGPIGGSMTAVAANGTRHGVSVARSSSPSPPEEGDLSFSHTTQGRNTKTHLTHGRSVFSRQVMSVH